MYKVTIKQVTGEVVSETIIETDDIALIKQVLVNKDIISVETDVPNQNINENVQSLRKIWEEAQKLPFGKDGHHQPLTPFSPSDLPFRTPWTVTC